MVILGSTGSIGVNSLKIAKKYNIKIEALSANSNFTLLNEQIAKFNPKFVCITQECLKDKINHNAVFCGENGLLEMLELCESKMVLNALVGFAGLKPTINSINLGKKVALANKESLVVGGKFIDISKINPIDSEHFGLKFLIGNKTATKLIITASGGALRNLPINKLEFATKAQVLAHPNWQMGEKITTDSATMVNKLFEILEAYWLFGIKNIDAIIEPKSQIHAFVEFCDGSTTAHFANTDMKLPIAHAILDEVSEQILPPVNLEQIANLEFLSMDKNRYLVWEFKETLLQNPDLGVVINAANEIGVANFLNEQKGFLDIYKTIKKAMLKFENTKVSSINELFEIDAEVRKFCKIL